MYYRTLTVAMLAGLLFPLAVTAQAVQLSSSDSMQAVTAAALFAAQDLLRPEATHSVRAKKRSSKVLWDAPTMQELSRVIVVKDPTRAGGPMDEVDVSGVRIEGDSVFVTIGVERRTPGNPPQFQALSKEYVVEKKGARWIVKGVRAMSVS